MRVGDLVRRTGGLGADGQLGRVVEGDDGVLLVRLNRAAQELLVPFREAEWSLANNEPMTKLAMAQIAYVADAAYRRSTGDGGYGIPDWSSMKDHQKHAWIKGPPAGASRRRRNLYAGIIEKLSEPDDAE